MERIWSIDRGDNVWKGIVGHTFWAKEIKGYRANAKRFKITEVEAVYGLNWQRKKYDAVINVSLEVVD